MVYTATSYPIELAVAMISASVAHTPSSEIPEAVTLIVLSINVLVQVVLDLRGDVSVHVLHNSISEDAMALL